MACEKRNIFTTTECVSWLVCRCTLLLAILSGLLLLAKCYPQTMTQKEREGSGSIFHLTSSYNSTNPTSNLNAVSLIGNRHPHGADTLRYEPGSLAYSIFSYNDANPMTLDKTNLTVTTSVGLEEQLTGKDAAESESSRLDTTRPRSSSKTNDTVSSYSTNSSTVKGTDLTSANSVVPGRQLSESDNQQRQESQSLNIHTSEEGSDPTTNCTQIKYDRFFSTPSGTGLRGVFFVEFKQQSSGLDTLQKEKNQSFKVQTSSTRNYMIKDNTHPSMLYADLSSVVLVDLEKESPILDTLRGQESQSSKFLLSISGSLTNFTFSTSDKNLSKLSRGHLTDIALVKRGHQSVGLNVSQRFERQLSAIESPNKQGNRYTKSATAQNLETRCLNPAKGILGSASNNLIPAMIRSLEGRQKHRSTFGRRHRHGRYRKTGPHLANLYGGMNRRHYRRHSNKIRHLTGSDSMNHIFGRSRSRHLGRTNSRRLKNSHSRHHRRRDPRRIHHGTYLHSTKPTRKKRKDSFDPYYYRTNDQYIPRQDYVSQMRPPIKSVSNTRKKMRDNFDPYFDQFRADNQHVPKQDLLPVKPATPPSVSSSRKNAGSNLDHQFEQSRVNNQHVPTQDLLPVKPATPPSRRNHEERPNSEWSEFQLESLKAHNEVRARHGVPSLKLRKDLCDSSQRYANVLAQTDPRERMEHSQAGENLSATGRDVVITPKSVVGDWYSEINNYNFETTWPYDESKDIGHFTQLIWRETTHVCCASATSASGATYVVCHYDPPGNGRFKSDQQRSFFENVPPPLHR